MIFSKLRRNPIPFVLCMTELSFVTHGASVFEMRMKCVSLVPWGLGFRKRNEGKRKPKQRGPGVGAPPIDYSFLRNAQSQFMIALSISSYGEAGKTHTDAFRRHTGTPEECGSIAPTVRFPGF
jgi:hypothetical protein